MNATTQLHTAIAARQAAREKVDGAAAAHERAQQADAEAQAERSRRNGEHEEWVARQSVKLDRWIEAGCNGPRPTLAADVKAVLALQSARDNADAAAASLQRFAAALAAARDELAAAERAVEAAVDAFLNARAIQAAQQVLQMRDEMIELARQEIPNPLCIPLSSLRELPPKVQEALALLEKMGPDDLNRPLNELSALSAPAVGIFRGHDNSYAERRAALIRGDLVAAGEATEPAAEQAA